MYDNQPVLLLSYKIIISNCCLSLFANEDIDECSEGIHDCSASEECVNRRGDYACRPKEEVSNSVTTVPSREKEGSDTNELDQTQVKIIG